MAVYETLQTPTERERLLRSSGDKHASLYDKDRRDSPFTGSSKRLKSAGASLMLPDQRVFARGAWQSMLRALQLPPYGPAPAGGRTLLDEHNVASLLHRLSAKKVPHLILYVKDMLPGSGNVFVKFVDPTGTHLGSELSTPGASLC